MVKYVDGAAFLFSGCDFQADHYAERIAQFNRLSTRGNSRWPAHARDLDPAMDGSRPRFRGYEHRDTKVRYHNHAQDTRVGNALFGFSGES